MAVRTWRVAIAASSRRAGDSLDLGAIAVARRVQGGGSAFGAGAFSAPGDRSLVAVIAVGGDSRRSLLFDPFRRLPRNISIGQVRRRRHEGHGRIAENLRLPEGWPSL